VSPEVDPGELVDAVRAARLGLLHAARGRGLGSAELLWGGLLPLSAGVPWR